MTFREAALPNGLRVVAETDPSARSAAVGFFTRTGARDEGPGLDGVSHFLEHMCFKGTDRRDAARINTELDEMGARANAFTSSERTVYFAQVLPEFLPRAVDLLADMMRPALRSSDFDLEKNVILEEIGMYDDRPDFLLFEAAMEHRFAGHPLATRVLGLRETIGPLPVEAMRAYHAERYAAGNVLLGAAGAVDFDALLDLARRHCGAWSAGAPGRRRPAPPSLAGIGRRDVVRPTDRRALYLALWDGPAFADLAGRAAAEVMADVLGDEVGSRLYWALVRPGIAESAYAGIDAMDGAGILYAGFAAPPERFEEARAILHAEADRLRRDGISAEEAARAATKRASRTVLRGETPIGRFHTVGAEALEGLPHRSIDDEIARILGVTAAAAAGAAARLAEAPATVALGPAGA